MSVKLENQKKENQKKEEKKENQKKKQKQPQQVSSDIEETLSNSAVIKTIVQGVGDLSRTVENLSVSLAKLQEDTNNSIKELHERANKTEQTISQLAQAISTIGQEVASFIKQQASQQVSQNSPDNNKLPTQNASAADKLAYWANLLTRLATLSAAQQQPPPPSQEEEGLGKGFDMMVGVFTKLLHLQTELRKTYLDEFKSTLSLIPKVLKGEKEETKKKKEEHIE